MELMFGRLGLDEARIPHKGRNGLVWLERGSLTVENGCMTFTTAGFNDVGPGVYGIPHQSVSAILIGPGSTVSHDALRILSSHGTALLAVGVGGVRVYVAPPLIPDHAELARKQAEAWADSKKRVLVARRMFAWRFGEVFPHKNLDVLRGIEGARVKRLYTTLAQKYGIEWHGRNYDRASPLSSDIANQAINHAATACYAAAAISVYAAGAIPQLGFIHEASGDAFCLDIADLYRMSIVVPCAFSVAKKALDNPETNLEREIRRAMGRKLRDEGLIDDMITRIKEIFDGDDSDRDSGR